MSPLVLLAATAVLVALVAGLGWARAERRLRGGHTGGPGDVERFRTAFERAYDAMVITDADGTVLAINDAALRINGFERSEVVGSKAGRLWGGLMPKAFYAALWHRIKVERKPYYGHFTNRRRNGEKYQAAVTISPIELPGSKGVLNFIAVERDLGEPDTPITPPAA